MSVLQIIAIVIAAVAILGFLGVWLFVNGARKRVANDVRGRLGGEPKVFDSEAHCYGLESRDHTYLSTFGSLGVNDDTLLYVQWSPKQEFELERSRILGVEVIREFRDRDREEDLVAVRFSTEDGEDEDRVAWKVLAPDLWVDELSPSS